MPLIAYGSWRSSLSPALLAAGTARRAERRERIVSATVAGVTLLLTAPLIVFLALLVKLTSRGPIFCAETRVGVDRRRVSRSMENSRRRVDIGGEPFTLYKLRTLRIDEATGECHQQEWGRPDETQRTSVGRLLNQSGLDQLPQLFNVLRGDMNVVGPRPHQPPVFAALRERVDHYGERQRARPGLTCRAQLDARPCTSLPDLQSKLAADLQYVAGRSALEDVRIMVRSVPSMFSQLGA